MLAAKASADNLNSQTPNPQQQQPQQQLASSLSLASSSDESFNKKKDSGIMEERYATLFSPARVEHEPEFEGPVDLRVRYFSILHIEELTWAITARWY